MGFTLVTGSSRGIGLSIAEALIRDGASVVLQGRTPSDQLIAASARLSMPYVAFDVSDKAAVLGAIAGLHAEHGAMNGLVNNAGVVRNVVAEPEEIVNVLALEEYQINYLGALNCMCAAAPAMSASGRGSVVNVSSIKSFHQHSTMSTVTYAASKAALNSSTRAFAKHYLQKNVRFNAVLPGYVETDMPAPTGRAAHLIDTATMHREQIQPDRIAATVRFLLSDEASHITGVELLVDDGLAIS